MSLIQKDNKNIDINVANSLSDNIEMLNENIITMFENINKSNTLSFQNHQNNFASSKMLQLILAHFFTFFTKENINITKESIDSTVKYFDKKIEDFKKNTEK
jgi:hypothetical protein